jgi:hypothetical protein
MSAQLQAKNDEMQAKNDHIREINGALVDSNRIKDRYVCHYIDLSVHYIKQIDTFRREVCRVARNKGVDELVRWLNTSQAVSGEYAKFYQSFDSSFLDIFPQFIEQVNALLQPESHFAPRADASLTTELRILAAIRLGITDSGHIAAQLCLGDGLYLPHQTPQCGAGSGQFRAAGVADRSLIFRIVYIIRGVDSVFKTLICNAI